MTNVVPVVRPPWSGLGQKIESMVRKACYEYELLSEGPIAVALSGGKDSLALLYMLHALSDRGFPPFQLHAIHVSGRFSCGAGVQLDYLSEICDQLDVNLIIRESHQELAKLECYSCSRERRKLIFDAAKEVGASTIAFGHHRDDNIQTLLMNLFHKGEFAGNLPKLTMEKYGVQIIRPLIFVSEAEIRRFAEQSGFARIMCRCPVGQNSMRKRVDTLIDEIEAHYPNVRSNLSSASLLYGSDKASKV
jgi:tRNA 2-thiocytidine biosynthesis protein TtcA